MGKYKVENLLNENLPKKYRDNIFWYANKVIKSETGIDIYISNENVVAFKEVAEKLNITNIDNISALSSSKWKTGKNPILISSGSFLWINNKIVITQRDANTSYDPLAWTTPAGRCDDTPYNTAIKETLEEIQVQDTKGRIYKPDIAKEFIKNNVNTVLYETFISFPENINQSTISIRTWFEEELIEEKNLWYYYNENGNTLELRLPITSYIDKELNFSNPEFHTSTKSVDISQLNNTKVVPALKNLLNSLKTPN